MSVYGFNISCFDEHAHAPILNGVINTTTNLEDLLSTRLHAHVHLRISWWSVLVDFLFALHFVPGPKVNLPCVVYVFVLQHSQIAVFNSGGRDVGVKSLVELFIVYRWHRLIVRPDVWLAHVSLIRAWWFVRDVVRRLQQRFPWAWVVEAEVWFLPLLEGLELGRLVLLLNVLFCACMFRLLVRIVIRLI